MEERLKILIVTHWFYPRQIPRAFRAYELYRELSIGNKVDVIIGDWKEVLSSDDDCEKKLNKYKNKVNNSNFEKLSNNHLIQNLKKIVEYFLGERYVLSTAKYIKNSIKLDGYDAVISIGLPFYIHCLTAGAVKKYRKRGGHIVYIGDWGDPFVGQTVKKIAPYFEKIQMEICSIQDYIAIPAAEAVGYYKKYGAERKINVIPQGIRFEDISIVPYKRNKIPSFAYAGIFYEDIRNPETFFKYLCTVQEDFVFTIYTIKHGEMYTKIISKYEKKMNGKLIVKEMIPRLDCIKELSKYDFLINISNMTTTQIPSKLIDYSLTKRPILSFKQNEIPQNKFLNFIHGNYDGRLEVDIEQFDIKIVTKQFLKLIYGDNNHEC